MRKFVRFALLTLLPSALAAPAIVWKNDNNGKEVTHSSKVVKASEIFHDVLNIDRQESSLAAVVFLLGRGDDGSESLSTLASSGALPGVASKYDAADCIHHHVSDMESPFTVTRDVRRANTAHSVLDISMDEFDRKLTSLGETSAQTTEAEITQDGVLPSPIQPPTKRARALAAANVVVVNVESSRDAAEIDSAIVRAIDHPSIKNVVVTGVRSLVEVKHARNLEFRRRHLLMKEAGKSVVASGRRSRRRLEENGGNANNNQDNGDNSMAGTYYVQMTPNIFSGLLFTLLFSVIAFIGISCMGMIQGQDVYVSKLPSVGREA